MPYKDQLPSSPSARLADLARGCRRLYRFGFGHCHRGRDVTAAVGDEGGHQPAHD